MKKNILILVFSFLCFIELPANLELESTIEYNVVELQTPPDCEGSETLTLCNGNIVIEVSGAEVSLLSNSYPSGDFLKIKIRTPQWQWVETLCTSPGCNSGVSLTIPQATIDQYGDDYVVDIQGACVGSFDFTINSGGGVDNDNDGICSDVDCDDDDPNLPVTVDTPCNDNNPNTENDMILAGECDCAGTSIGGKTKIAAIGDFGDFTENGPEFEEAVANLVHSWNPEAVITLGDNNYEIGLASTIDDNIGQFYQQYIYPYNGSYGSGSPTNTNRFWPSLGNHDWTTGSIDGYLDYFELPGNERYYDFVIGETHFFVVDSDPHEPDGRYHPSDVQPLWLQAELANSTSTWNVVYFHHPPYTSGEHHGNESVMQWPFTEWGADAVLSGHAHHYERLQVDGIPYFVNGASGRKYLHGFNNPVLPESIAQYDEEHGAILIEYDANCMIFKFINISNDTIDTHTIFSSNDCNITSLNVSTSCDDNGTEDPLDDLFNVTINPSGSNLGSQYTVEVDNVIVGTYNYGSETILPDDYLISSGNVSVEIQDNSTGSCSLTEVVSPPQPCSDPTDCEGSGNTLTVCNGDIELSISANDVTLVSNNYPSGDFLKIKIRTPQWQWVETLCTAPGCTSGVSLTIPQNIVDQYGDTFVADIQGACTGSFDFDVGGSSGGGVDNDNDGVCSDEDCDDNDPNIPTDPGTLCDDGDPDTDNDVIQADGCTCQGEEDTGNCNVSIPNDCTPDLVCVTLNGNVLSVNTNGNSFPKIDIHAAGTYSHIESICDSYSWTTNIPTCNGTVTSSPLPPGDYLLKVPDVNGTCWIPFTVGGGSGGSESSEDSQESNVLLGKNNVQNYQARVFPNPTSGILSVSSQLKMNRIIIYSMQGEKILEQYQDFDRIDMRSLANGIYLMRINTTHGIITKKVIKI